MIAVRNLVESAEEGSTEAEEADVGGNDDVNDGEERSTKAEKLDMSREV